MTGNVLIKNRTPSSDVPYLFGLPKQKQRFCAVQAFCAAKPWRRANSLRPSILISRRNPKRGHNIRCDLFFGAGDEARSQHCRAATRTVGDKRPTGAFSRFARALFAPLPAGAKKSALLRRTSVCAAKPWRRANSLRPSILISRRNPKRGHNIRCDLFFGAGDEARSQHCRAATRTVGDKRPTGAFSRFARALFAPLPAGAKK